VDAVELLEGDAPFIADTSAWWRFSSLPAVLGPRGNRQINRAHVIAITRGRLDPETRAYLQRKEAEGKTRMEAMRCLKRHLARRYYRLLSARSRHPVEHQGYPGVT
jgi:hypothetical protein